MYENWSLICGQDGWSIGGELVGDNEANPRDSSLTLRVMATQLRFQGDGATDKSIVLGDTAADVPFMHRVPDSWNGPTQLYGLLLDSAGKLVGRPSQPYNLLFANPDRQYTVRFNVLWKPVSNVDIGFEKMTGYLLEVNVVGTVGGAPKAIFLFRKGVDGVGKYADEFLQVCSPGQFAQYPEIPEQSTSGKYRSNVLRVVTQHVDELEEMRRVLKQDISDLARTLNINKRMVNPEYEEIDG